MMVLCHLLTVKEMTDKDGLEATISKMDKMQEEERRKKFTDELLGKATS